MATVSQGELHRIATQLYEQNPDWLTFFREVFGLGGMIRRAYPTAEELAAFEQSEEYSEIQSLLAALRAREIERPMSVASELNARVVELADKANEGELTAEERAEYERYILENDLATLALVGARPANGRDKR